MTEKSRICPKCGKSYIEEEFLPMGGNSRFSVKGRSPICVNCMIETIDIEDLNTIDRICQFLDVPFDANTWVDISHKYDDMKLLLNEFVYQCVSGKYSEEDWYQTNQMWEKARKYNTLLEVLPTVQNDMLIYLRKKWGHIDNFTLDEYMRMEEYERHTLNHYNFKDEARRDSIRKLAKISVLADVAISENRIKDATQLLQSYNAMLKESGIRSEISKDENTIDSLSELVSYLEKTGFMLNYKITENRDIVDKTIENMQQYVRRLFSDSNETVHEMYANEASSLSSGTEITDEALELLYDTNEGDEMELEETLDEKELEQMFKDFNKEYGE
jgi:uncharacterized coiled-coil protein SlyX